ncbi:MAG: hypothetical protein IAE89_08875 [Anaerolineae bacterium]|nr:hypothetical protein [Anaerolineae bacterium]
MDDVILIVFPSRKTLARALEHLSSVGGIEFQRAVILAKARGGEITVMDDGIGANEGSIAGGTLGAAMAALGVAGLGALALPGIGAVIAIGSAALAGAVVGGVTGRVAAGLLEDDHDALRQHLATRLESGHPALALSVKNAHDMLPLLRTELTPFKAILIEHMRSV